MFGGHECAGHCAIFTRFSLRPKGALRDREGLTVPWMRTQYEPGTRLSAFQALSQLLLSKALQSGQYYFPGFPDEKTHLKGSERFRRMERY